MLGIYALQHLDPLKPTGIYGLQVCGTDGFLSSVLRNRICHKEPTFFFRLYRLYRVQVLQSVLSEVLLTACGH